MQGLIEFVKTLGAPRIAAMGAVTIALIGFFAFLILRVTAPQMTPLFTDLSLEDSASIAKDLSRSRFIGAVPPSPAIVTVLAAVGQEPRDRAP